jgi:hypothetical protein
VSITNTATLMVSFSLADRFQYGTDRKALALGHRTKAYWRRTKAENNGPKQGNIIFFIIRYIYRYRYKFIAKISLIH